MSEPSDEADESTDSESQTAAIMQQANQYHMVIDSAKDWARETVADLRVEAALENDDEDVEQIEQVIAIVETVTNRIEQGDNNRARSVR